jgi:hypothetical protein
MIRVFDFVCHNGHRAEHFVDAGTEEVECECGAMGKRQIAAPRAVLEGITGAFPAQPTPGRSAARATCAKSAATWRTTARMTDRRALWVKQNPERAREAVRRWKKKNKARVRSVQKQWCEKNAKKNTEYQRQWRAEHPGQAKGGKITPEKACEYEARRRAAKLQRTPRWLSDEQRAQIVRIYEAAARLTRNASAVYHVDHIIPLRGSTVSGLHVPWNLQILRATDNLKKGNRVQSEGHLGTLSINAPSVIGRKSTWPQQ